MILADPQYFKPSVVDILFGADCYSHSSSQSDKTWAKFTCFTESTSIWTSDSR